MEGLEDEPRNIPRGQLKELHPKDNGKPQDNL
jgi:hypothetical protein